MRRLVDIETGRALLPVDAIETGRALLPEELLAPKQVSHPGKPLLTLLKQKEIF